MLREEESTARSQDSFRAIGVGEDARRPDKIGNFIALRRSNVRNIHGRRSTDELRFVEIRDSDRNTVLQSKFRRCRLKSPPDLFGHFTLHCDARVPRAKRCPVRAQTAYRLERRSGNLDREYQLK
jgi:hypothetical protein